jgi:hypothetical protein
VEHQDHPGVLALEVPLVALDPLDKPEVLVPLDLREVLDRLVVRVPLVALDPPGKQVLLVPLDHPGVLALEVLQVAPDPLDKLVERVPLVALDLLDKQVVQDRQVVRDRLDQVLQFLITLTITFLLQLELGLMVNPV